MNDIKSLVEHKHPIHNRNCNYWNFLLESYEGGYDYAQAYISSSNNVLGGLFDSLFKIFAGDREITSSVRTNLFQHPKETAKDYNARIQMSYYYNFCSPPIEIYINHLFKQAPVDDFGSIKSEVMERAENIDKKGGSIVEFRKELAEYVNIYGHMFVLCDMPQSMKSDVLTYQDVLDNDLFPYFSLYPPQNVLNWALDKYGRPYWVLLLESEDRNADPFSVSNDKLKKYSYTLWTREEWIMYDGEYKEIARERHGLGVVPIECVFNKQSKKARSFLGISALADISFIARDIYNVCSELNQIIRDQTFSILTLQGTSDEYRGTVGTNRGLIYPETRNAPAFISPASENAEVCFKHIDRQVTKIYQLAEIEGGSAQAPGQDAVIQSGVSKAWDFNQTNSALAKKASHLEDGEMKLWRLFGLWLGKDFDGGIVYPSEFSMQSLKEDMNEAEQAARIMLGKTFSIELKKAIVKKKFPRMPEDLLDKVVKEIEDNEGKGEGGRLMDRIPSLMDRFAKQTPNFGGTKKEEA